MPYHRTLSNRLGASFVSSPDRVVWSSCLADKPSKGTVSALFSGTYVRQPGPFLGSVWVSEMWVFVSLSMKR